MQSTLPNAPLRPVAWVYKQFVPSSGGQCSEACKPGAAAALINLNNRPDLLTRELLSLLLKCPLEDSTLVTFDWPSLHVIT